MVADGAGGAERSDALTGHVGDNVVWLQAGGCGIAVNGHLIDHQALGQVVEGGSHLADRTDRNADQRTARYIAVDDQLFDDGLDGGHGDGEAEALEAGGRDLVGGDADDLAVLVEQRAARIAGVDGSVGLNEGHHIVVDGNAAVGGRNDAGCDRALQVEAAGVADDDGRLADAQIIRAAEGCGRQGLLGLDLEDGNIGLDIGADEVGRIIGAVLHDNRDVVAAVDNVVVGDDITAAVHDDARTRAA